jgi:hypothetical protein
VCADANTAETGFPYDVEQQHDLSVLDTLLSLNHDPALRIIPQDLFELPFQLGHLHIFTVQNKTPALDHQKLYLVNLLLINRRDCRRRPGQLQLQLPHPFEGAGEHEKDDQEEKHIDKWSHA